MWLLAAAIRKAFENAEKSGAYPTAQQQLDYEARFASASSGDTPRLLTVAGNNAEIAIQGAITNRPSLFALMFGGGNTTYADINSALAVAEQDQDVDNITLSIDSPGGTIAGLFETLAAIEAAKKPIRAVVSNMAASAAYAIASQADEIIATNRAAQFGSIGIVVRGYVDENEVAISSTDAPKKAPDASTEEGKAIIREELDALHEIFVDAIASGRGTTTEDINANFGQGAVVLAGEALKRGMIDKVEASGLSVVLTAGKKTADSGGSTVEAVMDLNKLKAEHPAVYAEAVQVGEKKEHDRVCAFLVAGETSGDMKTAVGAINDKSEMTMTLQTQFMMAAANRSDKQARQDDDADADAGDAGSAVADAGSEEEAKAKAGASVLAKAAESCGVELEV